jgi:hypothetical protein
MKSKVNPTEKMRSRISSKIPKKPKMEMNKERTSPSIKVK